MKCNGTQQECTAPGVCLELGCQGKLPPGSKYAEVFNGWRARIKKLNEIQATEIEYARHRLDELDAHGLWDSAIAVAEWAIERDRLIKCLEELGESV